MTTSSAVMSNSQRELMRDKFYERLEQKISAKPKSYSELSREKIALIMDKLQYFEKNRKPSGGDKAVFNYVRKYNICQFEVNFTSYKTKTKNSLFLFL